MKPSDLLLIGSAPVETAEDMFRQVGTPLADFLGSIPDGEPGERRWWVHRLSYQVFNGHPDLETIEARQWRGAGWAARPI